MDAINWINQVNPQDWLSRIEVLQIASTITPDEMAVIVSRWQGLLAPVAFACIIGKQHLIGIPDNQIIPAKSDEDFAAAQPDVIYRRRAIYIWRGDVIKRIAVAESVSEYYPETLTPQSAPVVVPILTQEVVDRAADFMQSIAMTPEKICASMGVPAELIQPRYGTVTLQCVDRTMYNNEPTEPIVVEFDRSKEMIEVGVREWNEHRAAWKERERLEGEVESLTDCLQTAQSANTILWCELKNTQVQIAAAIRKLTQGVAQIEQWNTHLGRFLEGFNEPS